MFDNIGEKIKGLAKVTFIVEAIGAIIMGIIFLADDLILTGLLTLIGGPVIAWISSWALYGIGEAAEYAKSANYYAKQAFEKVNEKHTENKKTLTQTSITASICEPAERTEEHRERKSTFSVTDSGKIVCSQCNFEQPSGRKVCWHCGAKFENA